MESLKRESRIVAEYDDVLRLRLGTGPSAESADDPVPRYVGRTANETGVVGKRGPCAGTHTPLPTG